MLVVLFIITRQIGLGKKWARTLFAAFFIIENTMIAFFLSHSVNTNILISVILLLQVALHILAVRFLFTLKSTEWFNGVGSTLHSEEKL